MSLYTSLGGCFGLSWGGQVELSAFLNQIKIPLFQ